MRNLKRRANGRGVQAMPVPNPDRRVVYAKDSPAFAGPPSDGYGSAVIGRPYRAERQVLFRCPVAGRGKTRF